MRATKGLSRGKDDSDRKRRGKPRRLAIRPTPVEQVIAVDAKPALATTRGTLALGAAILLAGIWAYSGAMLDLIRVWNRVPDYSHGFLVLPLALGYLWLRRKDCPGLANGSALIGLPLFVVSLAIRYLDVRYYFEFLEGWSLIFWVASVVATLGGRPLLRWSLPAIGFLVFMIPLPFSLEVLLSSPLQRVATKISTWTLQLLGQPAFAAGNVILLGENRLEVAQACSGLRLFVSITALAYVYLAVVRRPWWDKLLLVAVLPLVALVANAARIVGTGLLYQATSSEAIRKFAHDSAGWGMILIAAALFGLLLWYLKLVIREDEIMDVAALIKRRKAHTTQ